MMANNSRGSMRPQSAGRTPSFIVIGLLVVIAILGFNYWNVSSKNAVLVSQCTCRSILGFDEKPDPLYMSFSPLGHPGQGLVSIQI